MSKITFLINGIADAMVSPLDRGLHYGDGVFRTIRVINGQPVAWDEHYAKLADDSGRLKLPCPDAVVWRADLAQLFSDQGNGVAKLILTRGIAERGYAVTDHIQITRIAIRSPLPLYPVQNATVGIRARLCNTRLSHQPLLAGIKHLNRLENVLARQEWDDPTISEGVMLDQDGLVVEGVMSNILVRSGTMLMTPSLERCGVAGITRQRILSMAPALGLTPSITSLTLADLMDADEVLMCNSLYGAWQVVNFNGRSWLPGQLASKLQLVLQE
ncbi:aminodeoxychorismate lyase [Methylobacillus flagellatus]|uniref:aminodeoxychorismate lyase n=1 Tax=Methylobacillus flagellatus (strain ATCC 51484 / DSM 6875 / VKM B-1610 / KT) TaxID=265072 RepID=Q1H167_METFK|nr:aminodeoxychorismate lyase [Methylobacillus flagellatus]ABE49770.1 aminodeoxychorismate lyase apoprotein [Methylobacillus flagellatus KT]